MLCNKRKPLLQTKQPVHGFQIRFEKEETVVYCFLGLSCSVENRTTTSLNTHVYKYLGNVCLFPTSIGGLQGNNIRLQNNIFLLSDVSAAYFTLLMLYSFLFLVCSFISLLFFPFFSFLKKMC